MDTNYAHAAVKLVQRGMTPKQAVAALVGHAAARGRARLVPRIARALRALQAVSAAREHTVLFVAHEKDAAQARKASDAPKDASVQIDETQIGGWRLRGKGRLVDATHKHALHQLYIRITT